MSELYFDIVHLGDIKHQAVDALSRLPTVGCNKLKLNDEILVLTINREISQTAYSVVTGQRDEKAVDNGTTRQVFVPFIPVVCALADKTEESNIDILVLHEYPAAQTADNECPFAAATDKQPKTALLYHADDQLVRVSPVFGASQPYVPAVLTPQPLRLCHYLLMSYNRESDKWTCESNGSFTVQTWLMTYMLQYKTASHAQKTVVQRGYNADSACSLQPCHYCSSILISLGPYRRR